MRRGVRPGGGAGGEPGGSGGPEAAPLVAGTDPIRSWYSDRGISVSGGKMYFTDVKSVRSLLARAGCRVEPFFDEVWARCVLRPVRRTGHCPGGLLRHS